MALSLYEGQTTVEPPKTPEEGYQVTEDLADPANSKEEPRATRVTQVAHRWIQAPRSPAGNHEPAATTSWSLCTQRTFGHGSGAVAGCRHETTEANDDWT
jgi:hypothetical protein